MIEAFGRTNLTVPGVWFEVSADDATIPAGVLSVTSSPAVIGHRISGRSDVRCLTYSGFAYEKSDSEYHAATLLSADLLGLISSLARGPLDFFALQIRRSLDEYQIHGCLSALVDLKEQGLVHSVGLAISGPIYAVLTTWRFHDAFDFVVTPPAGTKDHQVAVEHAEARRVGIVTPGATDSPRHVSLVPISQAKEAR